MLTETDNPVIVCPECRGKKEFCTNPNMPWIQKQTCSACNGKGFVQIKTELFNKLPVRVK